MNSVFTTFHRFPEGLGCHAVYYNLIELAQAHWIIIPGYLSIPVLEVVPISKGNLTKRIFYYLAAGPKTCVAIVTGQGKDVNLYIKLQLTKFYTIRGLEKRFL